MWGRRKEQDRGRMPQQSVASVGVDFDIGQMGVEDIYSTFLRIRGDNPLLLKAIKGVTETNGKCADRREFDGRKPRLEVVRALPIVSGLLYFNQVTFRDFEYRRWMRMVVPVGDGDNSAYFIKTVGTAFFYPNRANVEQVADDYKNIARMVEARNCKVMDSMGGLVTKQLAAEVGVLGRLNLISWTMAAGRLR